MNDSGIQTAPRLSPGLSYDAIVTIDPAYGGGDDGPSIGEACVRSADVTLTVAQVALDKIKKYVRHARVTRTTDTTLSIRDRLRDHAAMVGVLGDARLPIYIELRLDGLFPSVLRGRGAARVLHGDYAAQGLADSLVNAFKRSAKTSALGGAVPKREHKLLDYTCNHAAGVAVVVVLGSAYYDADRLCDPVWQRAAGVAIGRGIMDYVEYVGRQAAPWWDELGREVGA